MRPILALLLCAALAACASTAPKKDPHVPSMLMPNGGKTQSRSEGLGPAGVFVK